jgi:hypothetical protein
MPDPLRRLHARHACATAVVVHSFSTGAKVADGMMVNISLGGTLIDIRAVLERRIAYILKFSLGGPILNLPGRVIWDGPRNLTDPRLYRYGIQFNLTTAQERALTAQLKVLIRPSQSPGRDIMRDYWDR